MVLKWRHSFIFFSHAVLLWDLIHAFLPRSCSILEPLCFCFPAVPSEARNIHSKHFSWLIKLSILIAHTGNCNQIFHFKMFLLWNLSETHLETPTFYSQIIIWSTLIVGWISLYPESLKATWFLFVLSIFLFGELLTQWQDFHMEENTIMAVLSST